VLNQLVEKDLEKRRDRFPVAEPRRGRLSKRDDFVNFTDLVEFPVWLGDGLSGVARELPK
jgi:hypothetical protein